MIRRRDEITLDTIMRWAGVIIGALVLAAVLIGAVYLIVLHESGRIGRLEVTQRTESPCVQHQRQRCERSVVYGFSVLTRAERHRLGCELFPRLCARTVVRRRAARTSGRAGPLAARSGTRGLRHTRTHRRRHRRPRHARHPTAAPAPVPSPAPAGNQGNGQGQGNGGVGQGRGQGNVKHERAAQAQAVPSGATLTQTAPFVPPGHQPGHGHHRRG